MKQLELTNNNSQIMKRNAEITLISIWTIFVPIKLSNTMETKTNIQFSLSRK